jgi:hypothetical protein
VGIVTIAAFDYGMRELAIFLVPAVHCLAWTSGGFVIHHTDGALLAGLTELFWVPKGLQFELCLRAESRVNR